MKMEVYTLYCNEDQEIKLVTSNKAEIQDFIEENREGREDIVEVEVWKINRVTSDQEDALSYIGKTIEDGFCNGHFGRVYDMNGSMINNLREVDEKVELDIIDCDGRHRYTDFVSWEEAANCLEGWT